MNDLATAHVLVTGKVQEVWFRVFTRDQAELENVTGWVRNLPDGCVEAVLSGQKVSLEKVLAALHQGPPLARVDGVEIEWLDYQAFAEFNIV